MDPLINTINLTSVLPEDIWSQIISNIRLSKSISLFESNNILQYDLLTNTKREPRQNEYQYLMFIEKTQKGLRKTSWLLKRYQQ